MAVANRNDISNGSTLPDKNRWLKETRIHLQKYNDDMVNQFDELKKEIKSTRKHKKYIDGVSLDEFVEANEKHRKEEPTKPKLSQREKDKKIVKKRREYSIKLYNDQKATEQKLEALLTKKKTTFRKFPPKYHTFILNKLKEDHPSELQVVRVSKKRKKTKHNMSTTVEECVFSMEILTNGRSIEPVYGYTVCFETTQAGIKKAPSFKAYEQQIVHHVKLEDEESIDDKMAIYTRIMAYPAWLQKQCEILNSPLKLNNFIEKNRGSSSTSAFSKYTQKSRFGVLGTKKQVRQPSKQSTRMLKDRESGLGSDYFNREKHNVFEDHREDKQTRQRGREGYTMGSKSNNRNLNSKMLADRSRMPAFMRQSHARSRKFNLQEDIRDPRPSKKLKVNPIDDGKRSKLSRMIGQTRLERFQAQQERYELAEEIDKMDDLFDHVRPNMKMRPTKRDDHYEPPKVDQFDKLVSMFSHSRRSKPGQLKKFTAEEMSKILETYGEDDLEESDEEVIEGFMKQAAEKKN
eukprot:CAMPEP_0117428952 /NCGR_PEP_ID=MMETSP0758-20121206/8550_1 /TAXON_ID=63605 /ORGANISM="Percolomonas cosmopolitus, Strain AE-1 (ATCC 50343)" /LENGTH=517 /DNA_ID=CAMNT_0005215603 /DNA_START=139 /DNA_END=1691 /DNA_ORIENTATION=-